MYDQIREDTLYIMLYASVAVLSLTASCYLLFRRGNAIAPDITPPLRLRRWTAALLASITLSHLWFMPSTFFLTSHDDIQTASFVGGLLDCMTFFPLAIIVLLTMLQDRRRPLWPVWLMMMPLVVGAVWCVATRSNALLSVLIGYLLLICIGVTINMVHALRQYGRWLRDNYADLEHKELWQSFVVLAIILMVFGVYALTGEGAAYEYFLQLAAAVLIGYLLWRVETLSDLQPLSVSPEGERPDASPREGLEGVGLLLQRHCIDTQLYLQHDLSLMQLAKAIGTNRTYLSQYFSSLGMTYNTYINGLRINHFISLYREAVANQTPFTARQLAFESGYRSYSTFTYAFKQQMGKNVTAWIGDSAK
ncbi:MAG: helix-turn-helix domain-containing protein [Prevotella sp.]|nr:helix-turn-helix domain-containing protein [Prevotella sp.]